MKLVKHQPYNEYIYLNQKFIYWKKLFVYHWVLSKEDSMEEKG